MFLVSTADGKDFPEGKEFKDANGVMKKITWDDIPLDAKLTSVQLSYPFPVKFRLPDGTVAEERHPKFTIGGFDRYFFYNEAVVGLTMEGEMARSNKVNLVAKIVSGIDDKAKMVYEFRMDKWGNTNLNKYPLKVLEKRIKDGLFRKENIRDGS